MNDVIDKKQKEFAEKFNSIFGKDHDRVEFSRHSVERIIERLDGKLSSQVMRAIIKAIKDAKKRGGKYGKSGTYGSDVVVSKQDNYYLVITCWSEKERYKKYFK